MKEGDRNIDDYAHRHQDMMSLSLPIVGQLDLEELTEALEQLPPHYIRIKGVVFAVDPASGTDRPQWIVFHRVGARVSTEVIHRRSRAEDCCYWKNIEESVLSSCLTKALC